MGSGAEDSGRAVKERKHEGRPYLGALRVSFFKLATEGDKREFAGHKSRIFLHAANARAHRRQLFFDALVAAVDVIDAVDEGFAAGD